MARGGGNVTYIPPQPVPQNALLAAGQGAQDISQMLLQHFAQKEQLALQQETLKIKQQEFKLAQEQRAAEQQAALQMIQSNPELLALAGGARGGAQSTLQAPNLPAQAGGYASAAGMPTPQIAQTSQQQAPLAPVRPGGGLTPQVAGALLPLLQEQVRTNATVAESKARISESGARTALAETQGEQARFELSKAPELFDLNRRRVEADIMASQASAAASSAQASSARQQIALATRQYEGALRESAADQANKLDERFANARAAGMDAATASRWVYGTPTPPKRNALVASLVQELDPLVQAGGSAEDIDSLFRARSTQQRIDRLGISEPLQNAVAAAIQTNTKPDGSIDYLGVFEDARRSGMKSEDKVRVALMIEAVTGQMPDLSTIPEHRSVFSRIFTGTLPLPTPRDQPGRATSDAKALIDARSSLR